MQKAKKIILSFLNILIVSISLADTNNTSTFLPQTSKADTNAVYTTPNATLVRNYCPPIDSLVRNPNNQYWMAPGGWRTTSPSFSRSLDAFIGAQWVGVSVGEIICVYTKTDRSTFPVTLQRGKLVPAPTTMVGYWSMDKGGYMECKSNNIEDCPFLVETPKPISDVYKDLDFYKNKPNVPTDE